MSYLGYISAGQKNSLFFSSFGTANLIDLDSDWGRHPFNFNAHIPALCHLLFTHPHPLILTMPSNLTGPATDADVSGIDKFPVPDDQPAPVFPVHNPVARCTNLLHISCRIAGSDISVCRRKAAAMESKLTIRESESDV